MILVGVWQWLTNSTAQRAARIIAQAKALQGSAGNFSRKAGSSETALPEPPKICGTPVSELPCIGRCFSDDPAVHEAWKRDLALFQSIARALETARREDGSIDFEKLLIGLNLPVTAGISQQAAAAAFLQYMEQHHALLDRFRADFAKAPWDWQIHSLLGPEAQKAGWPAPSFSNISRTFQSLSAAAIITGNATAAWANMVTLRQIGDRFGEQGTQWGTIVQGWGKSYEIESLRDGISHGTWTDDQLRTFASGTGQTSAIQTMRDTLASEQEQLFATAADRATFNALLHGPNAPKFVPWDIFPVTDAQIDNSFSLLAAEREYYRAQLGEDGRYHPMPAGSQSPQQEAKSEANFLEKWLNGPIDSMARYVTLNGNLNPVNHALVAQADQDISRLQAGMELYRRQTGDYPATLDALAPQFPQGLPQDPATGQPYSYRTTAEGYTLWGTGMDQTNQQGKEESDVVRHVVRPTR